MACFYQSLIASLLTPGKRGTFDGPPFTRANERGIWHLALFEQTKQARSREKDTSKLFIFIGLRLKGAVLCLLVCYNECFSLFTFQWVYRQHFVMSKRIFIPLWYHIVTSPRLVTTPPSEITFVFVTFPNLCTGQ